MKAEVILSNSIKVSVEKMRRGYLNKRWEERNTGAERVPREGAGLIQNIRLIRDMSRDPFHFLTQSPLCLFP